MRFGTDGIRGVANSELTPELALSVGRAAARQLGGSTILVGRDTRRSGTMIEAAFAAGVASCGVDVALMGVLPTPALAFLSQADHVAAAMISASHNSFEDNGIKLFAAGGTKLDDDVQAEVEAEIAADDTASSGAPVGVGVGTIVHDPSGVTRYLDHLGGIFEGSSLAGLRVAIDCANGAASGVAAQAFAARGADVEVFFAEPDGVNINADCGSTHPDVLGRRVAEDGFDVGFALDGDADRVLAVDAAGRLVDGDQIMAMCAIDMADRNVLASRSVVVTVMTNLGFHQGMSRAEIPVVETAVGDRHVLSALDRGGLSLGGEQSGHVIFRDHATTGDGLLTALMVSDLLCRSRRPLHELADEAMVRLPQVLMNVTVAQPIPDVADRLADVLADERRLLDGTGRILIRPSGTEPLIRVMVEAPDVAVANQVASRLCEAVNTLR